MQSAIVRSLARKLAVRGDGLGDAAVFKFQPPSGGFLCSRTPGSCLSSRHHTRGLHIEPGAREKALLEEDPALKQFKSNKSTVRMIKRLGDVLVIIVSAGCIYQIYDIAKMRRADQIEESTKS